MQRNRQAMNIVSLGALLVLGWVALISLGGFSAQFADNSWQSNQIRIERYLFSRQAAEAMLLGSSVTGRLLPVYFEGTALPHTGNLGLDGSGPLLGASLLTYRHDLPRVVIVETFLIDKPWTKDDDSFLASVNGFSPWLAAHIPALRAEHRPSSLLYSWIKHRKESSSAAPGQSPGSEVDPSPSFAKTDSVAKLSLALASLQKLGVKVVLVRFPTGERRDGLLRELPPNHPAQIISKTLHLPLIDVAKEVATDGWEPLYTDGLHLNADSARRISQTMAKLVAPYLQ